MIIYISDFSMSPMGESAATSVSGYSRIGTRICNELVQRHEQGVIVLGLGYNGQEHPYPFSITPVPHLSHIPPMVSRLLSYGAPVEAIVAAMDIPAQMQLMQAIGIPNEKMPYIGLFPLEAGPLCQPWATRLAMMDSRLIMSEFGKEELRIAGLDSQFIPIGIDDPAIWRPPMEGERETIRQGLGIDEDTFMVLTVGENQERKNLSRTAEIFADFSVEVLERSDNGFATETESKRKTAWYLVTSLDRALGWQMDDLGLRLGIMDRMALFNRGVPAKNLWALFVAADVFLLTSKAEGLGIPVLEAMACRTPVAGTDCAAIAEHIGGERRGWAIPVEYSYIDPFGNENRYWASINEGSRILAELAEGRGSDDCAARIDAAQEYVAGRTWEKAGGILKAEIDRVTTAKGTKIDGEAKAEIFTNSPVAVNG